MRTVSYRIGDLGKAVIHIGHVAENECTRVQIDAGEVYAEYPSAAASLTVQPPEGEAFPAVVTRDGNLVVWDVKDSALTEDGLGEIQLTFTQDEVVVKSCIGQIRVHRSIVGSGETPDPIEDFLAEAGAALTAIPETINTALQEAKDSGEFDGPAGPAGEDGAPGADGFSPVVSVSSISGGHSVSVTDAGGTETFNVMDGVDGQDGTDGYSPSASVTKSGSTATIVITDKDGTTTAQISDGAGADVIDDTAGTGDTTVTWSANKLTSEKSDVLNAINVLTPAATSSDVGKFLKAKTVSGGKVTAYEFGEGGGGGSADLFYVTPEDYGAVGDGVTDDSQAVQDACDARYAVYFASNKTYYLASTVTIDHDCHLFGGENTVIKTKTPSGGTVNDGIVIEGTLKKTTTLTSDYTFNGDTANAGDRFSLSDMSGIEIGDIVVITAADQYYSYARQYYYLGGALLVADVTENYIYTSDALPFNIRNTNSVSVKIYSAPNATIENLHFESDLNSAGSYKYPLSLIHCMGSVVNNCTIKNADNGLMINECVNTLVDGLFVAKTPQDTPGNEKDHYTVAIYSSNNTTVRRVTGNAANSCIDMSGTIPSINTYIKGCELFAQNRHSGFGMHENAYNTVVEDCVLAGLTGYGTMTISRCRFVRSYRNPSAVSGISFRGNHVKEWSRLYVHDCIFENNSVGINILSAAPKTPIQAFNQVIDEIVVTNCYGGKMTYTPVLDSTVLSNKIDRVILDNWKNCYEFYHTPNGIIDNMIVHNCDFAHKMWINDHANHLAVDGIHELRLAGDVPKTEKLYAQAKEYGDKFYLPEGININCSSSNQTDHYITCGKNLASNAVDDWSIGVVSGSVGDQLSRSVDNVFTSALSVVNDELVFTQPDNTKNASIYPKCLVYVPANHIVKMSCNLKNTGETTGATFRAYFAIVSCATGLVTYRSNGTTEQATAQGATVTHTKEVAEDSMVLFYLYCSTPIAQAVTTLSNYVAEVLDYDFDNLEFLPYVGESRTGDGVLKSVSGENNLMTTASSFDINLKVDFMSDGFARNASGVIF